MKNVIELVMAAVIVATVAGVLYLTVGLVIVVIREFLGLGDPRP